MRRSALTIIALLSCASAYCQSISFDQLLRLLKEKDVEKYLTSAPFGFTKTQGRLPGDTYQKERGTLNEEELVYEPKRVAVIYNTTNVLFMDKLMKQIKYPLIIKSVDPTTSTYYQYGNTSMMIMIDIYGKKRASLTMYKK